MRGSKEEQGCNVQLTRDISLSQVAGSDGAAQCWQHTDLSAWGWFANGLIKSLVCHWLMDPTFCWPESYENSPLPVAVCPKINHPLRSKSAFYFSVLGFAFRAQTVTMPFSAAWKGLFTWGVFTGWRFFSFSSSWLISIHFYNQSGCKLIVKKDFVYPFTSGIVFYPPKKTLQTDTYFNYWHKNWSWYCTKTTQRENHLPSWLPVPLLI